MIVPQKSLVLFALAVTMGHVVMADDKPLTSVTASQYCQLVQDGIRIGNINDQCQTYFECKNGEAVPQSCPIGLLYDKDAQQCRDANLVDCNKIDSAECNGKTGYIAGKGCREWILCQNGVKAGSGLCPESQSFSDGQCRYQQCTTASQSSGLTSLCQIIPSKMYFGSFDDCAKWNYCTSSNNQPTSGSCTTTTEPNLVYDASIARCNTKTEDMCSRVATVTGACNVATDKPQADKKQCSSYFSCVNGQWQQQTCGTNFFDLISLTCQPPSLALTNANCNRCENRRATFVYDNAPGCAGYIYCNNGVGIKGSCGTGLYFNGMGCTNEVQPSTGPCAACSCSNGVDLYNRPACSAQCQADATSTTSTTTEATTESTTETTTVAAAAGAAQPAAGAAAQTAAGAAAQPAAGADTQSAAAAPAADASKTP